MKYQQNTLHKYKQNYTPPNVSTPENPQEKAELMCLSYSSECQLRSCGTKGKELVSGFLALSFVYKAEASAFPLFFTEEQNRTAGLLQKEKEN